LGKRSGPLPRNTLAVLLPKSFYSSFCLQKERWQYECAKLTMSELQSMTRDGSSSAAKEKEPISELF